MAPTNGPEMHSLCQPDFHAFKRTWRNQTQHKWSVHQLQHPHPPEARRTHATPHPVLKASCPVATKPQEAGVLKAPENCSFSEGRVSEGLCMGHAPEEGVEGAGNFSIWLRGGGARFKQPCICYAPRLW